MAVSTAAVSVATSATAPAPTFDDVRATAPRIFLAVA